MSRKVEIFTAMLDKTIVIEALENLNIEFTSSAEQIIIIHNYHQLIMSKNNNGKFVLKGEKYIVDQFLPRLIEKYNSIYNEKMRIAEEEMKKRLEEERIAYVEKQRSSIIEKAKKMGYMVKETVEEETIKLVLVKRTYD